MLVDGSGIPRRATGAEFAIGPPDLSYWAATHLPVTESAGQDPMWWFESGLVG